MRKAMLNSITITCVTMLSAIFTPTMIHALPPDQVSCSDTEVQLTTPAFIVLPTVRAKIPQSLSKGEQCKITFSTEAATAEDTPQLLGFAYILLKKGGSPDPKACEFLPGPVLARVPDGFDQTTTFISFLSEEQIGRRHLEEIAPCFSILPKENGQQARLRRHCLSVECGTR
jgi:hypothetical protein